MSWSLLPEIPLLEKIVRSLVVYLFLLVAFRVTGKRELGQITPFDLIVLLIISNVVQNALIGPDNSLGGGLVGALTLLAANGIVTRFAFHFPVIARLFEGTPTVLIEDGQILMDNLRREVMTPAELERAIREHDLDPATALPSIKRALLETDGKVTIILRGTA